MLTIDEALSLVEQNVTPLAPRRVTLGEAVGLVLAEDIISEVNSPPYDKAMMDGYAVRSGDRQPERPIVEEIAAGDAPRLPITPGSAARIMTGAPVPDGADAVVPLEKTELLDEGTVRLHQVDPAPGQNVFALGTSLRAGDAVLARGVPVRPIEIAILAEVGRGVVTAHPRPQIAVLPTGNELVGVGEKPAVGQIRNSNGPMLLAAAGRAGADAIELGIAGDDRAELTMLVEQGLAADILVLSGGVSAGKFDLVPEVLAELGVEQVFHKVALRPGKPLWFGVKRGSERTVLVFGLPGNPVSSLVCFELFVRPAIAGLAGRGFIGMTTTRAELTHSYDHAGGRAACLPARVAPAAAELGGRFPGGNGAADLLSAGAPPALEILPWHGSADLATLAAANAFALLSTEPQRLMRGSVVEAFLIQ